MMQEKVGFIFECGRDGPDYQVARCLISRLNSNIEIVPQFLDNTERLLTECGVVAFELLKTCRRVVIMWDLIPPWEGSRKPCLCEDRTLALESLRAAKVKLTKVVLICVEQELECWLMADERALANVLGECKHPHPIGQLRTYTRPDRQIKHPKMELISLFQRELGRSKKYVDRIHAIRLAQAIPNWNRLKRSASFRRFAEKAALFVL
jgi:hypothetical protein